MIHTEGRLKLMCVTPPKDASLSVSIALVVLSATSAMAQTSHDPAGTFRYQLKALGALAGDAVLTVSPLSSVGAAQVRRVRLEAKTAGVAGRLYKAMGDGTTVVDSALRPLRMKWRSIIRDYPRDAELSFTKRGVEGTYRHRDKFVLSIDEKTEGWPLDAISAYLWLPQQRLIPGARYTRPFFDGRRVGTLSARVGETRSIQVPAGLREVIAMDIVATTKRRERKVTFWIGLSDRVLYRIEVSHGILGTVQADLVGQRRHKAP